MLKRQGLSTGVTPAGNRIESVLNIPGNHKKNGPGSAPGPLYTGHLLLLRNSRLCPHRIEVLAHPVRAGAGWIDFEKTRPGRFGLVEILQVVTVDDTEVVNTCRMRGVDFIRPGEVLNGPVEPAEAPEHDPLIGQHIGSVRLYF